MFSSLRARSTAMLHRMHRTNRTTRLKAAICRNLLCVSYCISNGEVRKTKTLCRCMHGIASAAIPYHGSPHAGERLSLSGGGPDAERLIHVPSMLHSSEVLEYPKFKYCGGCFCDGRSKQTFSLDRFYARGCVRWRVGLVQVRKLHGLVSWVDGYGRLRSRL